MAVVGQGGCGHEAVHGKVVVGRAAVGRKLTWLMVKMMQLLLLLEMLLVGGCCCGCGGGQVIAQVCSLQRRLQTGRRRS